VLHFGVSIPATVPQRSEIPEGLMNDSVLYILNMTTSKRLSTSSTEVQDIDWFFFALLTAVYVKNIFVRKIDIRKV
jgi:hypothetical protein